MLQFTNYRSLPDPNDRTPNQPAILLQPKDITAIVSNQPKSPDILTDTERFHEERKILINMAREAGWAEITLCGKQILLIARVQLETKDNTNGSSTVV